MYIITPEYFKDYEKIPNIDEADTKASVELERFIDRFGRLFVREHGLTGLNQYLVNGLLPAVPTLPTVDPVPVIWRNLVTGCSYTKDGKTLVWKGLIYSEGTYKGSMLTDYVYYHWLKSKVSYVTQVSEAKGQVKGAVNVNSTQRLVTVWNNFVMQNQHSIGSDYRYGNYWNGFIYDWKCDETDNSEVSLLQFLSDNSTDYPDYISKRYEVQNQLGL